MPTLTTSGSPTINVDSTVTIDSTGADRVQAPKALLNVSQGWFAIRIVAPAVTAGVLEHGFAWGTDASNLLRFYLGETVQGGGWRFNRLNAGSGVEAVTTSGTPGTDLTVICSWTSTQVSISLNGAAFITAANTTIPNLAATTLFDIGQFSAANQLGTKMYWCAAGIGTLTNADAATIHSFGNSDPAWASFPAGGTITFLWKCNDFVYEDSSGAPPTNTLTTSGTPTDNADSTVTIDTVGGDRVQAPKALLSATQGWFAVRIVNPSPGGAGILKHAFAWGVDANNLLRFYLGEVAQGGGWRFNRLSAGSGVEAVTGSGTGAADVTVIARWTATQAAISLNGAVFTTAVNNTIPNLAATTLFDIGNFNAAAQLGTKLYWCAAGTGTLTDANATTIHGFPNIPDPIWASFPAAATLTFLWKAEDFTYEDSAGITVPTAPQSLQASAGDSQVGLSWLTPTSDGGSAITAYKIYRSTSTGGETLFASPAGTGTTYLDATTANSTFYYYKVSAVNAIGESPLSTEVSALPAAPAPLVATRMFKRLYGPTQLSNAAATLYTCPAGATAVVRHIHVSNPSGGDVDFTLSLGTAAAATDLWDAIPVTAQDVLDHYQDFTLEDGEIIQGFAGSAATLNLVIDGYETGSTGAAPPQQAIYPSDTLFPSDTDPTTVGGAYGTSTYGNATYGG